MAPILSRGRVLRDVARGALRSLRMGAAQADALVEHAIAALGAITAPEHVASDAAQVAGDIERAWRRSLKHAGLGGDLVARTEILNLAFGDKLLDPFSRAIGSAAVRVRRG